MDELIQVDFTGRQPLVSARELYYGLEIKTKYSMWFDRIVDLGFIEGQDFFPKMGQSLVLHQMSSQLLSFDHIPLQFPMQIHNSKHLSK